MRWNGIAIIVALLAGSAQAEHVLRVNNDDTLRAAARGATAGTHILIAPGTYAGGIYLEKLQGTEKEPIILEAEDAANPPTFKGGRVGFGLSDCSYMVLRDLVIAGQPINGLNIDDGGTFDTPAHHITLENLTIRDIGPVGNFDAIKLSGVTNFVVRNCHAEGWGGQGVDMVGCHDGVIESCEFRGKKGFSQDVGPQCKGGTSRIVVRNCLFVGPLERGINAGGSTGMQFFRPMDAPFEGADITVEGCRFNAVDAPIAFVGADGSLFRFNTVYHPRWALRILQENQNARLVRSHNGRYENNLIIFQGDPREGGVNIGPETQPKTFSFTGNWWYCEQAPSHSTPRLPAEEKDGTYGTDPEVKVEANGDVTIPADSPAAKVGAAAWKRP